MGVLVKLIHDLNKELGLTSIVVSHDVKETMEIADHVCIISAGKVVGQGSKEQIADSDSTWIRQFIDGAPDGPVPFHYPAEDYRVDLIGRIDLNQRH